MRGEDEGDAVGVGGFVTKAFWVHKFRGRHSQALRFAWTPEMVPTRCYSLWRLSQGAGMAQTIVMFYLRAVV